MLKYVALAVIISGSIFAYAQRETTYREVPPVSYRGRACQVTLQSSGQSTPNYSVSCYDNRFNPERQCSFQYSANSRRSEFGISVYQDSQQGGVHVTRQGNSRDIRVSGALSYGQFAETARKAMEKHCGDRSVAIETVEYRSQQIRIDGFGCEFETINRGGGQPETYQVQCYNSSLTQQCSFQLSVGGLGGISGGTANTRYTGSWRASRERYSRRGDAEVQAHLNNANGTVTITPGTALAQLRDIPVVHNCNRLMRQDEARAGRGNGRSPERAD